MYKEITPIIFIWIGNKFPKWGLLSLEICCKNNKSRKVILLHDKYLGKKILEVGAGLGSFTKLYLNNANKVVLSEIDNNKDNFQDFETILSDEVETIWSVSKSVSQ